MNNVLKHSAATKVKVAMNINALELEIKITDNGRGFDDSAQLAANGEARGGRGGNGLRNMRQRLTAVGGQCLVSSRPGAGATIAMLIRVNERQSK